jgi:glycosyltransferase involved in cell wall biosynthesis
MPSPAPLISCVVPAFNSDRYLDEAIGSILAQTYRPLQVIVADDGSTDATESITRRYGAPVELVRQATAGPAATRNLGVSVARGEFVAFLDADDLWHSEKLTRQMARFTARPELDLCITKVQIVWAEALADEARHYSDMPRTAAIPGYSTPALLARRHLFDVVGNFNTKLWFADATEWFMRAEEAGAILELLPEVLTYHRMHLTNLTRRRSDASRQEFLDIVYAALQRRRARIAAPS